MLGQKRSTECRRSLRVILSRPVVPAAGLQQIDPVLAAQKVQIAPAQIHAEIFQFMLRVQTDHSLSRLQHIAKQELEQLRSQQVADAKQEAEEILAKAQENAQRENTEMISKASKELVDIAVTAAEKIALGANGDPYEQFLTLAERRPSHDEQSQ